MKHASWAAAVVPGAGGKGSGERGDEPSQETEGVLAGESEVDERENDTPVDDVPEN